MTYSINDAGEPSVVIPKKEFTSIAGACAGIVALIGFLSFWAVIPERVRRLEDSSKDVGVKIEALQQDSAQRREMLAGALATLSQINDRTKRIEDHLLQEKQPVK